MTPFWKTLIFQACSDEPAVLHAVLALSSVHKRGTLREQTLGQRHYVPEEREEFVFEQYSKAIRHLQPHLLAKTTSPVRVALIACVVFTCLELIRGSYKAANAHLQNGLKLLVDFQKCSGSPGKDSFVVETSHQTSDDWIKEAFIRLYVQFELFREPGRQQWIGFHHVAKVPLSATFQSVDQARQHMDIILSKIFYLSSLGRKLTTLSEPISDAQLVLQQEIKQDLSAWLKTYKASSASHDGQTSVLTKFSFDLLRLYHTMACIMVDAALCPADETIYDHHITTFEYLIKQGIQVWKSVSAAKLVEKPMRYVDEATRSIADMGWIPPLYYTGIKCRDHETRLQAINLLGLTSHREGIWHAMTAANVARKVMEIEEGDFYKGFAPALQLRAGTSLRRQGLYLPQLPDSHKAHDIQVVPSEEHANRVTLSYRQRDGSKWSYTITEYDPVLECWFDQN